MNQRRLGKVYVVGKKIGAVFLYGAVFAMLGPGAGNPVAYLEGGDPLANGDYGSAGDNEIPDDDKGTMLFETPATLNDTWGYKSFDNNWKSPEKVREIREHLNSRGINYLLNVGPDALGRIPAPAEAILRAVGEADK